MFTMSPGTTLLKKAKQKKNPDLLLELAFTQITLLSNGNPHVMKNSHD